MLGYQNCAYDVDRLQFTYATRYLISYVMFLYYCNDMSSILYFISKALRSLQGVAGIYGMVVPSAAVQFPGQVVGHFVGGETLRAVLPKPNFQGRKRSTTVQSQSSVEDELSPQREGVSGYGVKLTYDVPHGKFNGSLEVRVCWHSLVYLAEVDFGSKNLVF